MKLKKCLLTFSKGIVTGHVVEIIEAENIKISRLEPIPHLAPHQHYICVKFVPIDWEIPIDTNYHQLELF